MRRFSFPVKYPEYADNLMSLAFLVRNQKLNRGLVCLNVVYEDKDMRYNQEQGKTASGTLQSACSSHRRDDADPGSNCSQHRQRHQACLQRVPVF